VQQELDVEDLKDFREQQVAHKVILVLKVFLDLQRE
jgi:hypothetical protein